MAWSTNPWTVLSEHSDKKARAITFEPSVAETTGERREINVRALSTAARASWQVDEERPSRSSARTHIGRQPQGRVGDSTSGWSAESHRLPVMISRI